MTKRKDNTGRTSPRGLMLIAEALASETVNDAELARMLNVRPITLPAMRCRGEAPDAYRLARGWQTPISCIVSYIDEKTNRGKRRYVKGRDAA